MRDRRIFNSEMLAFTRNLAIAEAVSKTFGGSSILSSPATRESAVNLDFTRFIASFDFFTLK
ncbi:MAG: hypothetical protein NC428_05580 [Clostridium sp.]|nr:hypothetical protein [Clostridium sp.]